MKEKLIHCQCEFKGCDDAKSFPSPKQYTNFLRKINDMHIFNSIKVEEAFDNVGTSEIWLKCEKCNQIWRLVEPDPPFLGLWEKVKIL